MRTPPSLHMLCLQLCLLTAAAAAAALLVLCVLLLHRLYGWVVSHSLVVITTLLAISAIAFIVANPGESNEQLRDDVVYVSQHTDAHEMKHLADARSLSRVVAVTAACPLCWLLDTAWHPL